MDVVGLQMAKADAAKKYVPIKTRRAVFGFGSTGNQSANTSIAEATYRLPGRLPQTPTRVRLHIRNYDTLAATAYTGALAFTGMWIGQHTYTTTGSWTGITAAAPIQALTSFSTPADGSEYVSAWITDATVLSYLARGNDFVLSFGMTCAAGQSHTRGSGQSFIVTGAGKAALANQASPSGLGSSGAAVLWDTWLEYDFAGNSTALFVPGNSLDEGVGSTHGTSDAWTEMWARRCGGVAVTAGVGSAVTANWTDITRWQWAKWQFGTANAPAVDAVVMPNFSNDLGGNVLTVSQMQANWATIVTNIRTAFGASIPIYGITTIPRSFTGTQETNRTTLNTWVRTLPFGMTGVLDFDRAVRDPATITQLDADYNSGDGIHPTTGGYAKFIERAVGSFAPPLVA